MNYCYILTTESPSQIDLSSSDTGRCEREAFPFSIYKKGLSTMWKTMAELKIAVLTACIFYSNRYKHCKEYHSV